MTRAGKGRSRRPAGKYVFTSAALQCLIHGGEHWKEIARYCSKAQVSTISVANLVGSIGQTPENRQAIAFGIAALGLTITEFSEADAYFAGVLFGANTEDSGFEDFAVTALAERTEATIVDLVRADGGSPLSHLTQRVLLIPAEPSAA